MKGRKRKLGYVTVSTSKTTEARAVPLGTSAEKELAVLMEALR